LRALQHLFPKYSKEKKIKTKTFKKKPQKQNFEKLIKFNHPEISVHCFISFSPFAMA
jgi:hypothetical protein